MSVVVIVVVCNAAGGRAAGRVGERSNGRVDLIKWVSKVCPYVRTYVCPSTKRLFDFIEIWHVGRGLWVMHDGMQYDPIQGQGHEPLKVVNSAIFIYNGGWQMTTDS